MCKDPRSPPTRGLPGDELPPRRELAGRWGLRTDDPPTSYFTRKPAETTTSPPPPLREVAGLHIETND
jgi:hypothetical protein